MSGAGDGVTLDASARELVAALAAGRVSAVELAEAAIARIEARDPPINAVVVRDFDRALEAARAADAALAAGERRPLLGLPMTVKESHNIAGLPTTFGFEAFRDQPAARDGVGISRLKAAGAVILGKTNVPVALADWQSVNPVYGRTNNPWDLGRSPGGSSGGGAAALAAGMVPLEFGSDIGGSIRIPAAFCGVYGHKPSFELIPRRGHGPPGGGEAPAWPQPLSVVGPLARTAQDLALALDVLAGPDLADGRAYRLELPPPRGTTLRDFRILVLDRHPSAETDDEIRAMLAGLADGLAALGARVARTSDRLPDLAAAHQTYATLLNAVLSFRGREPTSMSAVDWVRLLDAQAVNRAQWAALFEDFDVVLAPNRGTVAFPHVTELRQRDWRVTVNGRPTPYFDQLAWPGIATLAHLPATAAPMGVGAEGLPLSVQIIGPYLEDRTPLAFAALLEREFGGFSPPPSR